MHQIEGGKHIRGINTCRQDSTRHRILLAIFLDETMLPNGWGCFCGVGERISIMCYFLKRGQDGLLLSFVAGDQSMVSLHDVEEPWKFSIGLLSRFLVQHNLTELCIDKLHLLLQCVALCFWIQGSRHCWFAAVFCSESKPVYSSEIVMCQLFKSFGLIWVVWSCFRSTFLSFSIVTEKR